MQIGFWQILVIVLILVLLFGRGKISALMGDVAQGIKNFKKGMAEDTPPATDTAAPSATQVQPAASPVTPPSTPSTTTTPPVPTAGASVAPNSNTPDTRAS